MLDWSPLYDKIIVRRDPPEKEYTPGISVAETHQKQQHIGTVLKVGHGRWMDGILLPLTIVPGMRVLFSKFAGSELSDDVPDVVVLREDEILAYAVPELVGVSTNHTQAAAA
jgi:chaperonin GroES